MYRFVPLVLCAGLATAGAAQAQAQQQPAQQVAKPMTRAEFVSTLNARFSAIDTNKDGSLSSAEIAEAQRRSIEQVVAAQQQQLEAEFKKLDTNNDNQLSLAEFRAAAPQVRAGTTPAQMIADVDTNKDGKLSAAEFNAAPLANFDRADANKDGSVSPEELQAAQRR